MENDKLVVEEAWAQYHQQLLSFIRSRVSSLEVAEDILSEVYIKLALQCKNENSIGNVLRWLYTVTKNAIADHYRHARPGDDLPEALPGETPVSDAYVMLSHCMLPIIQALPENYRRVIELSDIEEKKQQDVADILGLSLSAVKSRVLRGRAMVRDSLAGCCTLFFNKRGQLLSFDQKNEQYCKTCDD